MGLLDNQFKIMLTFGSISNIFVFVIYGYDGALPSRLYDALSEPISLSWFSFFAVLFYAFWMVITRFGARSIPDKTKRRWFADNIIKPMLDMTDDIGIPILGYSLGSAVPAILMYEFGLTEKDAYSSFILISATLISVLCLTHIIKINIRNKEYESKTLMLIFVGQVVLGVILIFGVNSDLLRESVVLIFSIAFLVILTMAFNINSHPDSIKKRLRSAFDSW
ncbi:hypothetical protein [Salinivibrio kushneri]|uniref:hypothetical protein n=1 Tax=Salinivibrio kushneri TaxID=1908198 RepID=UPI0022B5336A|nr:hypothetical protein [Salinivibrio kushneri]WBA13443.1 hypothetical protein O4546_14005 [Salinivibrio kushneri]